MKPGAPAATRSRAGRSISSETSPSPAPTGARRFLALLLATAGGAGYAPVAPGTFGSMVGVALFVPLAPFGVSIVLVAAALLLAVGTWAADETEKIYGKKDDGRIVMDEVVGQLVTLAPLVVMGQAQDPLLLLAGFFVFRFFDIWKPGPARAAERGLPGGLGVMMDDVVAGVLSAITMVPLALALAYVQAWS